MHLLSELDDLYICSLFFQHHRNIHPTLEHLAVLYPGMFYSMKLKLKWSLFVTHNTSDILHGIEQWTKHFSKIIRTD